MAITKESVTQTEGRTMTAREFVDSLWSVYDEHQQIDATRCRMEDEQVRCKIEDKLTLCEMEDKLKYVLSNIPANEELTRNQAAKILHTYMRDVLGILDITDENVLHKATELRDLYDCRICAADIMQVYLHGMMDAGYVINETGMKMFGGGERFTTIEFDMVKERLMALKRH